MNARQISRLSIALLAVASCTRPLKFSNDDSGVVLSNLTISAPNPGMPGTFRVLRMYYGSGTDKNRPEYKDSVTYKTKPVDVSPFATIPPATAGDRKAYWGFDLKAAPINGRVWYPEGNGPFPLVLVVHGNHNPQEYSDPGYDYLGELMASRGFILASVDENFINGLGGENDGRAWLMLKHVEQWKKFNDSTAGPMSKKVDLSRIALIGHSRGGEAVAHAATFNRLKYFPDDFKQRFNFNFDIKGIIAIAPVDGQYQPSSTLMPVENVDYLLLHGSHDGDVSTAVGLRTYDRVKFTDGKPHFKSTFYMYRANHGQWNTVWNNKDTGPRSGRTLDLRTLVPVEDQRQMGRVVMSAFLEAVLNGKKEYLPFFRDHRTGGQWLPKTLYTTRFQESSYQPLATFDEDIDITTGVNGVTIEPDSLSTWRENVLPFRGRGGDNQRNNAAWVGWNRRIAGSDTMKFGRVARLTINIPDSLVRSWAVSDKGALYLSVAPTKDKPGPRAAPRDTTKRDTSKAAVAARERATRDSIRKLPKPPKPNPDADTLPIDFTVELVDADGKTARAPINRYGPIRRPFETRIYRRYGRDETRFATMFEIVPQTFVLPFADFTTGPNAINPAKLKSIRLVFDRAPLGTIILNDIGLSPSMDPAYLAASLRIP
jgi:dienelactone hydrolase